MEVKDFMVYLPVREPVEDRGRKRNGGVQPGRLEGFKQTRRLAVTKNSGTAQKVLELLADDLF